MCTKVATQLTSFAKAVGLIYFREVYAPYFSFRSSILPCLCFLREAAPQGRCPDNHPPGQFSPTQHLHPRWKICDWQERRAYRRTDGLRRSWRKFPQGPGLALCGRCFAKAGKTPLYSDTWPQQCGKYSLGWTFRPITAVLLCRGPFVPWPFRPMAL